MNHTDLCGWRPNPGEVTRYVETLATPRIREATQLYTGEKLNVYHWLPLMEIKPAWKRGAQGIGDCTSWAGELCSTLLMAAQARRGQHDWVEEAATEPIYGGARVEANGGKLGGYSDGWYGSGIAKWLTKWGVLVRVDYSKDTGQKEHDLRKYDSKKAKAWGNFGCGGESDAGRSDGLLDKVARQFPVRDASLVKKVDELIAAMTNGYPVNVCSGVGYGSMQRNAEGVVKRSGSWAHAMCFGGIRWTQSGPQFRLFQSWGKSCSGPDPGIDHPAVSDCSWWVTQEDAQRQLDEQDSFAYSSVEGFPPQKLDWAEAAKTWVW